MKTSLSVFQECRLLACDTCASCKTDFSDDCTAYIIRLVMEAILSSETSVLTRATRCHIPEDGILHSQP
jgi:hypothetical protein